MYGSASGAVILLPTSLSRLNLSSTPQGMGSYHTVERRTQLHGHLTPAPSLWPGRELRKYHYPLHLSSPPPGAARILRISFIARLVSRVVAHLRLGSTFRSMQVTYLMKWIFNFQRSLSGGFCPLTFLLVVFFLKLQNLFSDFLKYF